MARTTRSTAVGSRGASGDHEAEVARAVSDLALAVQRHRIYPSSSPLCVQAIEAFRVSLKRLPDALELRVSPSGLDADAPLPATPMVEELAGRLFRADVESVRVDAGATVPELARFARLLARWERREQPELSLTERLVDEGVTGVRAQLADRLQVLDLAPLSREDARALKAEREARDARVDPADGGDAAGAWVRAEIDLGLASLDLVDLALLIEDPVELARVVHEARGDRTDGRGYSEILSGALRELVDLYGTLSPGVAAGRFRELARTLMSLEEARRARLIDEVLVSELLETGRAAPLVAALPDDEIASLLRRLGERRVGAPGLVEHALERVDLSRTREAAVREALDPPSGSDDAAGAPGGSGLRTNLQLEGGGARQTTLLELAARDLSVDPATEQALAAFRSEAAAEAEADERLRCHAQLVQHVLNPHVVEGFLARTAKLLHERRARGEGRAVSEWIERLRLAADAVRLRSPEVAESVDRALRGLCPAEYVQQAVREWEEPGAAQDSRRIISALGPLAAPQLLEALEREPSRAARRRLIDYMRERARALAPGLLPHLDDPRWTVVRNAVSVLGFAGERHVPSLAGLLDHAEPRIVREAFLALARIGSEEAAASVAWRVRSEDPRVRAMACESVRLFPRERGARMAAELLADPEFHRSWPEDARQMLRHFFAADASTIERPTLEALLRLRAHLWDAARMRLGWTAWAVLRRRGR